MQNSLAFKQIINRSFRSTIWWQSSSVLFFRMCLKKDQSREVAMCSSCSVSKLMWSETWEKISINHANIADLLLHGHIFFLKIYSYYSSCTFYHYYFSFSFWTTRRDGRGLPPNCTHLGSIPGVRKDGQRPCRMSQLRGSISLPCNCPFIE